MESWGTQRHIPFFVPPSSDLFLVQASTLYRGEMWMNRVDFNLEIRWITDFALHELNLCQLTLNEWMNRPVPGGSVCSISSKKYNFRLPSTGWAIDYSSISGGWFFFVLKNCEFHFIHFLVWTFKLNLYRRPRAGLEGGNVFNWLFSCFAFVERGN